MRNWTINCPEWDQVGGIRVSLYLDPENREVYRFAMVGLGYPREADEGGHILLGGVDLAIDPNSLATWLATQTDRFDRIAAADEYADIVAEVADFNDALHKALAGGYIARTASPEDFIVDLTAPAQEIAGYDSVREYAVDCVAEAVDYGLVIDVDDMEEYLNELLAEGPNAS